MRMLEIDTTCEIPPPLPQSYESKLGPWAKADILWRGTKSVSLLPFELQG